MDRRARIRAQLDNDSTDRLAGRPRRRTEKTTQRFHRRSDRPAPIRLCNREFRCRAWSRKLAEHPQRTRNTNRPRKEWSSADRRHTDRRWSPGTRYLPGNRGSLAHRLPAPTVRRRCRRWMRRPTPQQQWQPTMGIAAASSPSFLPSQLKTTGRIAAMTAARMLALHPRRADELEGAYHAPKLGKAVCR